MRLPDVIFFEFRRSGATYCLPLERDTLMEARRQRAATESSTEAASFTSVARACYGMLWRQRYC